MHITRFRPFNMKTIPSPQSSGPDYQVT